MQLGNHLVRIKSQAECCRSDWPEQKSAFLHGAQKEKSKAQEEKKAKEEGKKERKGKNKGKEKRKGKWEREMERGITLLKEN